MPFGKCSGRGTLAKISLINLTEAYQSGEGAGRPPKWSMGVLNDKETIEVPGSVLLLADHRNEPLGLQNMHAKTFRSSLPAGFPFDESMPPGETQAARSHTIPLVSNKGRRQSYLYDIASIQSKKKTEDGRITLEPQPDDSANDPLNWPSWRRDLALLSLGFYCMIGGGVTPSMAAGFQDIASEFGVPLKSVALTTGLCMMGNGIRGVIMSPTAILYGKRPVYLASAIMLIATSLWCAWSPSFPSLVAARVFQGMSLSPVECLPSATIAEIFFLHERAFRIGIYTLLLLSGKNLVPLLSAVIIGGLNWRWTFWIMAMVVFLGLVLLFAFVPETFWDRTPSRRQSKKASFLRRFSALSVRHPQTASVPKEDDHTFKLRPTSSVKRQKSLRVGFAPEPHVEDGLQAWENHQGQSTHGVDTESDLDPQQNHHHHHHEQGPALQDQLQTQQGLVGNQPGEPIVANDHEGTHASSGSTATVIAHNATSKPGFGNELALDVEGVSSYAHSLLHCQFQDQPPPTPNSRGLSSPYATHPNDSANRLGIHAQGSDLEVGVITASSLRAPPKVKAYTHNLRQQPAQSFVQHMKPFRGRLINDKWYKVMLRPFILVAYPSVLWSAAVYACSVGWLIVISETMAMIYREQPYNFTALETGLVYLSPFIGSIFGTGIAGTASDMIVKAMARRNGGLYEPEFRLVMAIPILFTTCIGLMGFGWSAQRQDSWIVPTVFFGILSFGCSLGSTTSITFCVDSYRQYAGEALVTMNFCKNILHGLVFSLFVPEWMRRDGPKEVFICLGLLQLCILLFTIPMYIFGKRARMWTTRMNLMERF